VRTHLSELSPWLMITIGFVFFAVFSACCRYGLSGVASPERRAQVEEHAGKLLSVFGATFAFLIGFAITITWSAVSAGQDAVDLQASSASNFRGPRVRSKTRQAPTRSMAICATT
jgi:hypothetical protein